MSRYERRLLAISLIAVVWSACGVCWLLGYNHGQRSARAMWKPVAEQCVGDLRQTVDQLDQSRRINSRCTVTVNRAPARPKAVIPVPEFDH